MIRDSLSSFIFTGVGCKTFHVVGTRDLAAQSKRLASSLSFPEKDQAINYAGGWDAVIRVYDEAGNVIDTYEQAGDFKEP
jgi:hypothetical protein